MKYILAIESSCDETSVSIVRVDEEGERPRFTILSNQIASQIPLHTVYGGVVPEIASRAHAEAVSSLTYQALEESGVSLSDIDCIGVTAFPGLIGALLVGVNFAKSLAFANNIPLIPVCHVFGHAAANYFTHEDLKPPYLALVASGGHTSILRAKDYTTFETVGRTRDDAIGEAFDKVARVMGMPYPGGKEMDRIAYLGDPEALRLPSAAIADDSLDFSFSGLKTAVINYLNTCAQKKEEYNKNDVAASFSRAVVSSIIKKLDLALKRTGETRLVLAGGVAANSHIRAALEDYAKRHRNITLYLPELSLCGDNGAMIAAQAYFEFMAGRRADTTLNARAVMDD
ncbi:MAG: tRNA (adenosine(37)-N6)-threonylcarbamoyltransferase complex transferase subunit TsaD [Clostridia bacterium]|nr:tRNA (adenosine(37)-N6)-threonylcarbamoyltransferase complex transferase subunit TsaD [Clostridia bacterium]